MNKLYGFATKLIYELTWPFAGILLHNSRRVRVLVQVGDEVLLQRSSYGSQAWSLPGGGIEKNENPFQAAIREVYEETGVKLHEVDLLCIGERRMPIHGSKLHMAALFYVARIQQKPTVQRIRPLEVLEVGWFRLQAIPEKHSKTIDIALEMVDNK